MSTASTSVATVRGPVAAAELGTTLMHEHVFVLNAEVQQNRTDWDEDERVANAVAKLNEVAALGVETIVDVTVLGLGRYVPRLQRIAAATRMVLSHDAACWLDWFDPDRGEALRKALPNWHYRHIHEAVLPALEGRGIGSDHVRTMLVENPRRLLGPVRPY